jgi:hypothetical protein
VPTLALHGINGETAGNYHLINEESNGGRGYRREIQAHRQGIHLRNGILPGITSLFTQIQAGKSKFAENPSKGNNSRNSSSKSYVPVLTIPTLKKKILIRRTL